MNITVRTFDGHKIFYYDAGAPDLTLMHAAVKKIVLLVHRQIVILRIVFKGQVMEFRVCNNSKRTCSNYCDSQPYYKTTV